MLVRLEESLPADSGPSSATDSNRLPESQDETKLRIDEEPKGIKRGIARAFASALAALWHRTEVMKLGNKLVVSSLMAIGLAVAKLR